MNRAYRLVWSEAQQAWVPAPESTRRRGKSGGARTLIAAMALISGGAFALPTGGQVSLGQGSISQAGSTTLNVSQQSQNLSVNWNSFNIGSSETVNFNQPNSSAIALNRILGSDPSQIYGHLNANGQVFLINPNGVLFGQAAQVNIGGLVASTLNITDKDFAAGNYHFSGTTGSVTNLGAISTSDGGYVALLGGQVSNQGTISAKLGSVDLAAGSDVTIDFAGDGLLSLQVNQGAVNALAENKQLIEAEGGQVLMSAKAANSLATAVVNNTGMVDAETISNKAGVIELLADPVAGTVNVGGTLDASAPTSGNGGQIETSAATVNVGTGTVTAAAKTGKAGSWLIDPTDLTIDSTAATTIDTALNGGTDVTEQTTATTASGSGNQSSGNGDINVSSALSWSSGATLTLSAYNSINIDAPISVTGAGSLSLLTNNQPASNDGGNLNLNGGSVQFTGAAPGTLDIDGQAYTLVQTMAQLQATGATGDYALVEDLSASAVTGFTPIASGVTPFSGTFNGLGNTVSSLTIVAGSTQTYAGLFGNNSGTISNLGLINAAVTGSSSTVGSFAGALVAWNTGNLSNDYASATVTGIATQGGASGVLVGHNGGTLSNDHATGSVSGTFDVGGLVGNNNTGSISNSYAGSSVTGSTWAGGLTGFSSASITNSYATGNVSGSGAAPAYVGGLVGENYGAGTVSNDYATGTITGGTQSAFVGGLAGDNIGGGTVSNSYATGAVSGGMYVGGLVGDNYGGVVSSAYALGVVSGQSDQGGLIGYLGTGSVTKSYWDTQTAGQTSNAAGTGLTTTALEAALPSGFSSSVWGNAGNRTTPYLLGNAGPVWLAGAGSAVYTAVLAVSGLEAISQNLAGNYLLGNNITFAGASPFTPIGSSLTGSGFTPFSGVFNGMGNTITGLTINTTTLNDAGLFAGNSGTISNVGLVDPSVTGSDLAGTLAASNSGTISGSYAVGVTVTAPHAAGGLVGLNNEGTLSNDYTSGSVSGSFDVGGLVGDSYTGTVTNSYSSSSVSGGDYVGGLVGFNGGTVSADYATGIVSGTGTGAAYVGGLIGDNYGGTVSDDYASGAVNDTGTSGAFIGGLIGLNSGNGTATNSYATGAVAGGSDVGGLAGYNSGGTVTDSYSTGAVSGQTYVGGLIGYLGTGGVAGSYWNTTTNTGLSGVGNGSSAGTTGLTSMNTISNPSTGAFTDLSSFAGWSIDDQGGTALVWRIYGGETAPLLRSFLTPVTLTVTSASTTYDQAAYTSLPTYTVSNPAAILSGTATITGSASGAVSAGSYSFNVSGLYSSQQGYDIIVDPGTLTINPVTLTLTNLVASNKGYDSTTAASATGGLSGILSGDTVTDTLSASFATANVGTGKVVTVTGVSLGGAEGIDYTVATGETTTASISPATLTASLTGTVSKTYTGTTAAALTAGNYALSGVMGSDSISLNDPASGTYASQNVGTNINVSATGLSISGAAAGNYVLGNTTANANIGTISPATLTASLTGTVSKSYTGTTNATLSAGNYMLSGVLGSDSISLNNPATGTYASQNAGNDIGVSVTGLGVSGAAAGNYQLASSTVTANIGTITPATLTLGNVAASNKVYDTTATASVTGSLSGVVNGDTVSDSLSASFANANAGTGKVVTVTGISLGGAESSNYTVAAGETTTADITPATLTVSVSGQKIYDGSTALTSPALTYTYTVLGNDQVSVSGTASFGALMGDNIPLTASGLSLSGAAAGNYRLASTTVTGSGSISPAPLFGSLAPPLPTLPAVSASNSLPPAAALSAGALSEQAGALPAVILSSAWVGGDQDRMAGLLTIEDGGVRLP